MRMTMRRAPKRTVMFPLILLVAAALVAAVHTGGLAAQGSLEPPSPLEVYVREIRVGPSKVLSEAELDEVVSPFEGRTVTEEELYAVVDRINALYAERGYVTAIAVLPPQTIEDGVVTVTLVEGVVGTVVVSGNASTRSEYITGRIGLYPGDIVSVSALEEKLVRFNVLNDVQLKAQLRPGESFGTTDYILHVQEPRRWQGALHYANTGRDEVGADQIGLVLTDRSLLGYRDRLSLSIVAAEGTTGGALSYSFPVGRSGSRLAATYYKNQIEVVAGEFEGVGIGGAASGGSVALSYPAVVRPETKATVSLEYHHKETATLFGGVKLIGTVVQSLVYAVAIQTADDRGFWEFIHSVSGGSWDESGRTRQFTKYNGSLKRESRWRDVYTLKFRALGQASTVDLLPNSEQFSLGGLETARGIPSGALVGDEGYFVSAEIERALAPGWNVLLFLDHGGVYPFKGNDEAVEPEDFATTVGLGANFQLFNRLAGTMVYGSPLNEAQRAQGRNGQFLIKLELAF